LAALRLQPQAAAPFRAAFVIEPAFKLHDTVEYRWSAEGPFVGKAEIVELLSDGRYRLERLDGTSFPREGSRSKPVGAA
jgi:hypothetical protein